MVLLTENVAKLSVAVRAYFLEFTGTLQTYSIRLGYAHTIRQCKRIYVECRQTKIQGEKKETPRTPTTLWTPKQYRKFACEFFSDFNVSRSQCFGTVIGVQSV